MKKHGLYARKWHDFTDENLDTLVRLTLQANPCFGRTFSCVPYFDTFFKNLVVSGFKRVHGILTGQGYKIAKKRIFNSYKRVSGRIHANPRPAINRRCYFVLGPLSMWHIDGNHKLIR